MGRAMAKKVMEFQTRIKIHFDEADPAGMVFAGHIFNKIHRCYEEFIEALGQNSQKFFMGTDLIYPIRRMEAEYFKPLSVLNTYQTTIRVCSLSESAFQLQFDIKEKDHIFCQVRSIHVCCEKQKMKKTALPGDLRQKLELYLEAL